MKIVNAEFFRPTPPPPVVRLSLELSHREAIALHTLCRNIGGDPNSSPRGIFDQIEQKLNELNIPHDKNLMTVNSGIDFIDWPARYR